MAWVARLWIGCGLAFLAVAGAQAQPADSPLVQPNPGAVIGRLPNGLRYAVLARPTTDHATMSLYIDAGTNAEGPAQAGAADLLAHIGFAQPRDNDQAGRTAQAGPFETTFVLDIPEASSAQLRGGLDWLRGLADGMQLTPDEIAAGSKDVAKDIGRQDKTDLDLQAAVAGLFTPQLRIVKDRTAARDQIADYYRRWYRPDNAIVVLISPLSTDQLQPLIARAFGSWARPQAPLTRPAIAPLDPSRPLQAAVFSAPSLLAAVQVCRLAPAAALEPESVPVWRRRLADEAWAYVLQTRLNRLARAGQPSLAEIQASLDTDDHLHVDQACIHAGGLDQNWQADLTVVAHETRRLALYGVTDEEIARFKDAQKARLEASIQTSARSSTMELADIILANLVSGDTFDTPQEDQRVHLLALQAVDKAAIAAAFNKHWTQAGQPLMLVTTADPANAEEVKSVWLKAVSDAVTAPPEHTPADPPARTTKPSGASVAAVGAGKIKG